MPAPYSYLGGVQPVDLSREMAGITAGLGGGLATALQMQAAQQQARIEAEQQAAMQAQFAEDMRDYSAAPSVEKYGLMLGRYPNMRKQLQEVQKRIGEDERKGALSFLSPTLSLLQGGQTDLAIEQIQRQNEALRNSGRPEAAARIANGEAMIKAIERGPEGVNAAIGQLIQDYAIASGVSDQAGLMELQAGLPYAASYAEGRVAKQEAETKLQAERAKEQAIKTGFADEVIQAGIAKDIEQAKNYAAMQDVAREQNRIEWYKARLQKEKGDLQSEELRLRLREAQQKRNGLLKERKADLDLAAATLDSAIELVKKIKASKTSTREGSHGPQQSAFYEKFPASRTQDIADYMALVDTLKAKNFSVATKGLSMAGVAKAETDKLQDALGSLALSQSVKQFDYWLDTIKSFSEKNKQVLQDKFNATPGAEEMLPGATEPIYPSDF